MAGRRPHPELPRNLALIGGRGCGKSSVSKRLAQRNRNFQLFSLDALIRYERGGMAIPEIVAKEGWAGFRELEYQVIRRVAAFEGGALIDCGGGVVVDLDEQGDEVFSQRKVEALRSTSLIVYLARDVDYLRSRIEGDENRPDLSRTESFVEIMERREPLYRRAADWVVDCDDLNKDEIADAVLREFYGRISASGG